MLHWYTRYRISNALDEGELASLRAGGHLGRCRACQDYARDLRSLHARLALGAPSAPGPAAAPRSRRPLRVAVPLALAAAASIALAVGLRGPTPVARVETPPPAIPVLRLRDLTDRVSSVLARSDAPLDTELQNLIRDGRRGLDAVLARSGLVE